MKALALVGTETIFTSGERRNTQEIRNSIAEDERKETTVVTVVCVCKEDIRIMANR